MKRILTIQDISCFGKCSLTVALPVISAMGTETVILPTALLSTHTLFKGFTCLDLSGEIDAITRHWEEQDIHFDAIYTGYLGTEEQIETVKDIIRRFKKDDTLIFIDPVMGDNGKLYPAFNEAYAERNASLCAVADVIVPNITEACFMTGEKYLETYDEAYIKGLLKKLADLGAGTSILTGVSLSEGKTGVMGLEAASGRFFSYQNDKVPAMYHGTGDLFSSSVIGCLMRGLPIEKSLAVAADYVARTIDVTRTNPENPWYGVDFEKTLPELISRLEAECAGA